MKKLGKNLLRFMPFMLVFAGAALFAADPTTAGDLVKDTVKESKVGSGGFIYVINAWLPLGIILAAGAYGFMSGMKKKAPDDGMEGVVSRTGISTLVGVIVAFMIWGAFGLAVKGEASAGLTMAQHYLTTSVEEAAGADVFTKVNN